MIASQFGIIKGYGEGSFRGDQRITREEEISMNARAYRFINPQQQLSPAEIENILAKHTDSLNISTWAQEVHQL